MVVVVVVAAVGASVVAARGPARRYLSTDCRVYIPSTSASNYRVNLLSFFYHLALRPRGKKHAMENKMNTSEIKLNAIK